MLGADSRNANANWPACARNGAGACLIAAWLSVLLLVAPAYATPARLWFSLSSSEPYQYSAYEPPAAEPRTVEVDLVQGTIAQVFLWGQPQTADRTAPYSANNPFLQLQNLSLNLSVATPAIAVDEVLLENPGGARYGRVIDSAEGNQVTINPGTPVEKTYPVFSPSGVERFAGFTTSLPTAATGFGPDCQLSPAGCRMVGDEPVWLLGSAGVMGIDLGATEMRLQVGSAAISHAGEIEPQTQVIFGGADGVFYDAALNRDVELPSDTPDVAFKVLEYAPGDFNTDRVVDAIDYAIWRESLGLSGTGLPADANDDDIVDAADLVRWRTNFGQGIEIVDPAVGPGDFNADGTVDAIDYAVWRESLGEMGAGLPADASGNGVVGPEDLDVWRANYGASGPAPNATPEPLVWWGLLAISLVGLNRRTNRAVYTLVALTVVSVALCGNESSAAEINARWQNPVDGTWTDPMNWDPAGVPNNGADTYDVTIDADGSGTPYTVTLNSNVAIDNLLLNSADGRLIVSGMLTLEEIADLMAGELIVASNGVIQGGTIRHMGSSLRFSGATGQTNVLDGVVLEGDLNITSPSAANRFVVSLQNGTTFTGNANLFSNGGGQATLSIPDAVTLDNKIVNLSGSNSRLSGADLTFGPNAQVNLTGGNAALSGVITNQGTITSSVSTFNSTQITASVFDNQGAVEVASGTLNLSPNSSWSNTGTYLVQSGATLNFNGSYTTATLGLSELSPGTIENTAGGTVNLQGTINNADDTLLLDGSTGNVTLSGNGVISGGVIDQSGGALLFAGSFRSVKVLDNVTLLGDLNLNSPGFGSGQSDQIVLLQNGATFTGDANLSGARSTLAFAGNSTINNRTINAAGSGRVGISGAGVLTLGPGVNINLLDANASIESDINQVGEGVVINQGTITASDVNQIRPDEFRNENLVNVVDGGSLTLTANSQWTNTGTYRVQSGGVLTIQGNYTTASVGLSDMGPGQIEKLPGGSVQLTGTLDNTGDTLLLDSSTGSLAIASGTILGGMIQQSGGSLAFGGGANTTSVLDGATLEGDLVIANANRTALLRNGATFTGNASVSGANLALAGTGILDGQTINVEQGGRFGVSGSGVLTLGPSNQVNLTSSNARIQSDLSGTGDGAVINQGTVTVSGTGARIEPDEFHNQGLAEVVDGGVLTLTANADWTNTGRYLIQSGGQLTINGNYTTASVGLSAMGTGQIEKFAGGSVQLSGTLDNTGDTLLLDSSTGALAIASGTILGGTIQQSGGSLAFGGGANTTSVLDGVTLIGDLNIANANRTAILRNGATFTGNASVSGANLALAGTGILDGQTINVGQGGRFGVSGSGVLTLGPSNQVNLTSSDARIQSDLSGTGDGSVINQGTIEATGTSSRIEPDTFHNEGIITFSGRSSNFDIREIASTEFQNSGALQLVDSALTRVAAGTTFDNTGTILVDANTRLTVSGSIAHTGPARLTGSGTVDIGNFINEATVAPGNSPGILTIDGDYTQTSAGRLEIEVAGTPNMPPGTIVHDELRVTGAATLAGRLDVPLIDGFTPAVGQEVVFLTAASVTGGFENYHFPSPLPENVAQRLVYSATDVRVEFVEPIPIDFVSTEPVAEWSGMDAQNDWEELNGDDTEPESFNILSVDNNTPGAAQRVDVVAPMTPTDINAAHSLTIGDATDEIVVRINDTSLSTTQVTMITANGAIEQTASSVLSSRMLKVDGGGRFSGAGMVIGDVEVGMNGLGQAMVEVGDGGVGHLEIDGEYSQGAGGVLSIDIAGDNSGGNHDTARVSGGAALDGAIHIDLSGLSDEEFTPGARYELVTAAEGVVGEFGRIKITGRDDIYFDITYESAAALPAEQEPLGGAGGVDPRETIAGTGWYRGDGNQDGLINDFDAVIFASVLIDNQVRQIDCGAGCPAPRPSALLQAFDFQNFTADGDPVVDFFDIPRFAEVLAFSQGMSLGAAYNRIDHAIAQALSASDVPEPGTGILLMALSTLWATRRSLGRSYLTLVRCH